MVSYIGKYLLGTAVNLLSRHKEELNAMRKIKMAVAFLNPEIHYVE